VKITPEGQVKVLDFGLASALEGEPATPSDLTHSPTLTARMTQHGMVLGTAAYMSPEQARGEAADARADIWSWGVVFYEMLTGERLFAEPNVSETLAAVLRADFRWGELPPDTSPAVRKVLRRSLERDPRRRWHAIADARIELEEADESERGTTRPDAPASRARAVASAAAGLVAVASVLFALWAWRTSEPPTPPRRLVADVLPPEGHELLFHSGLSLAPDGSTLVFGARDLEGRELLWLRDLATGRVEPLPGTERGTRAFWSPSGQELGFVAEDALETLSLRDGVVDRLADAGPRSAGTWGPDGTIVFTRPDGILRIPAGGGEPVLIRGRDVSSLEFLCPFFLPGGNRFAYLARDYTSGADENEIRVSDLDGKDDRLLVASNSCAALAPSGELVWWEGGHLRAQSLDLESLQLTGAQRTVQTEVQFDPPLGQAMFAVASEGTLVFRRGPIYSGDRLSIVDRQGTELRTVGPPGNYYYPRISPDGTRVAVDRSDTTNRGDVWIFSIDRGTGDRVTSVPQDESDPVWSPDGRELAIYSSRIHDVGAVHLRAPRPGGEERVLFEAPGSQATPHSWSPRGFVAIETREASRRLGSDAVAVSLDDGELVPIATTPFHESSPELSPDGRFVMFCSDETGRPEVYLQSFPDPSLRLRVSTDGGCAPAWNPGGGEVFYVDRDSRLLAVPVELPPNGSPVVGAPAVLFHVDFKDPNERHYDTVDGSTFLVNRRVHDQDATPLTLVAGAFEPRR
jgi:Tol biopolymer transport system component